MSRRYAWGPVDPLLAALPYPAPDGALAALTAATGIPRPSLDWRLRRLRHAAGHRSRRARAWSEPDDARVAAAIRTLAHELGRTPQAVLSRAAVLGLDPDPAA